MSKQIMKMDKGSAPALSFSTGRNSAGILKICRLDLSPRSNGISKRVPHIAELPLVKMGKSSSSPFRTHGSEAFDALFPTNDFKMGTRVMPSHAHAS